MRCFTFRVDGDPIPKPRMTASDRWKQRSCVLRYRAYGDLLRKAYVASGMLPLGSDVNSLAVQALIAMPTGWSKKKRTALNGAPHRARPDADNILKAVSDHLLEEDGQLWKVHCEKFWSSEPCTIITLGYECDVESREEERWTT